MQGEKDNAEIARLETRDGGGGGEPASLLLERSSAPLSWSLYPAMRTAARNVPDAHRASCFTHAVLLWLLLWLLLPCRVSSAVLSAFMQAAEDGVVHDWMLAQKMRLKEVCAQCCSRGCAIGDVAGHHRCGRAECRPPTLAGLGHARSLSATCLLRHLCCVTSTATTITTTIPPPSSFCSSSSSSSSSLSSSSSSSS
jgi:hypothetical protein